MMKILKVVKRKLKVHVVESASESFYLFAQFSACDDGADFGMCLGELGNSASLLVAES